MDTEKVSAYQVHIWDLTRGEINKIYSPSCPLSAAQHIDVFLQVKYEGWTKKVFVSVFSLLGIFRDILHVIGDKNTLPGGLIFYI